MKVAKALFSLSMVCFLFQQRLQTDAVWFPKEAAEYAVDEFNKLETERMKRSYRGTDRRSSAPFVTGDGFRLAASTICEDFNQCRIWPERVENGSCVFVKSDFFDFFVNDVTYRIPEKVSYTIISHNGDLSTPDGQTDIGGLHMQIQVTSNRLAELYGKGTLIAHHGQNLWWTNKTFGAARPEFSHCLPIGFENRHYPVGEHPGRYVEKIKSNIIDKRELTSEEEDKLPLLLIAFYPKGRSPDRAKVLRTIGALPRPPPDAWYNKTDLSHSEWLDAISEHKFVLAPFGHGLDTHRLSEIFTMGGIPVTRRSTISSCYDDSDNTVGKSTRGSLPIVILDKWEDLTKERLEAEWKRIKQYPKSHWDWKRLFLPQWLERTACPKVVQTNP
jgi:hypothetical protein